MHDVTVGQVRDRLPLYHAGSEATCLLVTALDEVAWVLNLRGSDVPYNPVFMAYLAVLTDKAILFIDPEKALFPWLAFSCPLLSPGNR